MATDLPKGLHYRLPRSTLVIAGSVTHSHDPLTKEERFEATSDITLGVEADAEDDVGLYTVDLSDDGWHDREIDLRLAPDGRLVGSSTTTTGVGGQIVEAGIRLVSTAAAAAITVARFGAAAPLMFAARDEVLGGGDGQQPRTLDEAYAAEYPELAERRSALRESILALQKTLAETAEAAAAGSDQKRRSALRDVGLVEIALESLRSEASVLETHFDAWRSQRIGAVTQQHSFKLLTTDLRELPDGRKDAPEELPISAEDLGKEAAEVARVLDVALLAVPSQQNNHTSPDDPDGGRFGIFYREPRQLRIAIYDTTEAPDQDPRNFALRTVKELWVLDSESEVRYVDFGSGFMNKDAVKVDFGDSGALSELSSTKTATAGQVAAALSAAPGQVQGSIDAVVKTAQSLGTLRSLGAQQRLDDLKRQQDTLEADIAVKGALASRDQQVELARIKAEADNVAQLKQLGADLTAIKSLADTRKLTDRTDAVSLQLQLAEALGHLSSNGA
ncbi:MAG: hypothetical protein ACJ768_11965 [Gaiellaceae bacterium]